MVIFTTVQYLFMCFNNVPKGRVNAMMMACIRRDKLNSQFIVTKFSILHAGGRSLFRFRTSRETRMATLEVQFARAPPTNF